MATTNISIGTVNSQITNYNNAYGEVASLMLKINNDYFNTIQNKWNSTTAYNYFSAFVNAMNETINKMNKGFVAASEDIQKVAHYIAENEGGTQVKKATTPIIKTMSLNWQGKEDNYNISDDVGDVTKNNFTNIMIQIIDKIETCKKAMETIRNQGLSDCISGATINNINNMIDSVKTVAQQYDKDATQNAATQDRNTRGYSM